MSTIDSMDREQKKRQLKKRIIESDSRQYDQRGDRNYGSEEEEIVRNAEQKVRQKKRRIFLVLSALVALTVLASYQYITGHLYTSYAVAWEKKIPTGEGSFIGYERFGDNLLKYSKDGASYINKSGDVVWSISYELKSPICYVSGDYVVIGDQLGNDIYICDLMGSKGQAETLLPILRVSVSSYGVVAALVEDSKASYITFFKNDGSSLDWGIKTVMSKNGYLMDVSLSPDGTQVMLSDLYIQDGGLKNRIVFYNFSEFGKSYPDRLVGGFDEFSENICPRVRFLDEGHACAVTDGSLVFFSLENVTSPAILKQIPVETEIKSVAYSNRYVAMVVSTLTGENPYRLEVYKSDGSQVFTREFDYPYKKIDVDGDFVFLYNEDSCKIYSMSGRERFSGQFDFTVSKITKGFQFNSFIITGGDSIREIRLK